MWKHLERKIGYPVLRTLLMSSTTKASLGFRSCIIFSLSLTFYISLTTQAILSVYFQYHVVHNPCYIPVTSLELPVGPRQLVKTESGSWCQSTGEECTIFFLCETFMWHCKQISHYIPNIFCALAQPNLLMSSNNSWSNTNITNTFNISGCCLCINFSNISQCKQALKTLTLKRLNSYLHIFP